MVLEVARSLVVRVDERKELHASLEVRAKIVPDVLFVFGRELGIGIAVAGRYLVASNLRIRHFRSRVSGSTDRIAVVFTDCRSVFCVVTGDVGFDR